MAICELAWSVGESTDSRAVASAGLPAPPTFQLGDPGHEGGAG